MCWGVVHPEEALEALNDYPGEDEEPADFGPLSTAWVEMARGSVDIYSASVGLPDYNDKTTWHLG